VRLVTHDNGDVGARVQQRFDEALESLRLCLSILEQLREHADSAIAVELPTIERDARGVGFVESWRGPVLVALDALPGNRIDRLHVHDPSWQNWPVVEHAIIGNIVPDFPLINKSFNLSYSGHDL
jgi:Ni,Fe-hydrogenase III large subunit